MRGAQRTAIGQGKIFCYILYKFDHTHIFLDQQPRLRIVAEDNCVTDIDLAAIRLFRALQYIDKGRFAHAILADHAYAFAFFESIIETF